MQQGLVHPGCVNAGHACNLQREVQNHSRSDDRNDDIVQIFKAGMVYSISYRVYCHAFH